MIYIGYFLKQLTHRQNKWSVDGDTKWVVGLFFPPGLREGGATTSYQSTEKENEGAKTDTKPMSLILVLQSGRNGSRSLI